jgi:[calcium/calmodulin-dependent protein kinase] kinase
MFDKQGEMKTAKSAGSPAFMPPELCVPKHGQVSGRAADIWSMGVTLYCLLFGRIPFEKHGMIELYESIRTDELEFDMKIGDDIRHLLTMLLEKDPEKRINMEALRVCEVRRRRTGLVLTQVGTSLGYKARDGSFVVDFRKRRCNC